MYLRSWWEVPSIAHFCSLFRAAFDLSDFDIEDLEDALLESQKEGGCEFLTDLVCKLLNGCYGRNDICSFNYDLYVKDVIKYKWDTGDNPIRQKSTFSELTLREKVEVIHSICEYRLDGEDVMDLLKGFDGDSMRVEPLGKDKEGGLYWYFYGSRLYKEDPEPNKEVTKEQKKKSEREKRRELAQKKKMDKQVKKKEKLERQIARRVEKKKLLELRQKEEEEEKLGNRRRSGRIQKKQELKQESESSSEETSDSEFESEDSSSDSEEDTGTEDEESSSGTEIEEPPVETKPEKIDKKKETPSKNKKTPAKPVPVEKKAGRRQSQRKKPEPKKTEEEPVESTRRSGRLKQKKKKDQSDEEDDDLDKHSDSESVRSEVSRRSTRSEISTRSDSAKKELPTRSSRQNKKYCDSVEKEERKTKEQSKSNTDNSKTRTRRSSKIGKQSNKTDDSNRLSCGQSDCDENNVNGAEAEEKDIEPASVTTRRSRRSRHSTESKPTVTAVQENGVKKTDPMKSETEIKHENKENVAMKKEPPDPDGLEDEESDKQKEEVEKLGSKTLVQECKTEVVNPDDSAEMKNSNNHNEDSTSEIKKELDEKSELESEETAQKSTEEHEETMDASSKEAADTEEKEKDEKEAEEETEPKPRPKPTPPPRSKTKSRWHLICSTLDDWINLVEWFKESTVRCEKTLSKVMEEDFLPVLPEIIETREKEKKRRQHEIDLRKSARITQKQRERIEQEKILAEAAAEEEQARKEAEEERRLKEEQQRLEEENRLREERVKAREERAKRLSMREERARLVAEGKEIPPELIYTGLPAQRYKDDFDSDESRSDLLDDESFQSLLKVIDVMKNHKDCWPFLEPVTEDQAPGYHDVIKRPMDLSKIEKKVELREYRTQHHFLSDFRLMFNNCKRFNSADSDFTECAKIMEKLLKKLVKKYLLEESTDAYYIDDDFAAGSATKAAGAGQEKKYRPKRQAGTKAMQTVQKALNSDESSSDEDSYVKPLKKPRKEPDFSPSVNSMLLQEMIEFKRKRAEQMRSPEKPSLTSGIMIMPKEEIPTDGVLRLAASREIKWKIDKNRVSNLGQSSQSVVKTPSSNPSVVKTPSSTGRPAHQLNVVHKKAAGLAPGQKIIKILAQTPGSGVNAVRQTAENVKVSHDGYLILNGKATSIKVTPNTKIVIQPQGSASSQGAASAGPGKELIIKKIPTPAGCTPLADLENSGSSTYQVVDNSSIANKSSIPTVVNMETSKPATVNNTQSPQQSLPHLPTLNKPVQMRSPPTAAPGRPAIQTTGPNSIPNTVQSSVEMRLQQYDIAQRLLAVKRKQLMQNGPVGQKMARLDSNPVVSNSSPNSQLKSAMSEPLKGVSSNIQARPANVLSNNVVQNVNIAGDILDSYYSVMNEANLQKPIQTNTHVVNNTSVQNLLPVKPDLMAPRPPVEKTPQAVTSNIAAVVGRPNIVSNSANQVTKNLSISALTTALARSIAAGNALPQRLGDTQRHPQTDARLNMNPNSIQLTGVNQVNHSTSNVSIPPNVINLGNVTGAAQQTPPNTPAASFSAALSKRIEATVIANQKHQPNLLTTDSVNIHNQNQISNTSAIPNQTRVAPNEGFLTIQTSMPVTYVNNVSSNGAVVSPNPSVYSNLTVSPPKSDRQNLFDMFEPDDKQGKVPKLDDFGFSSLLDRSEKLKHPPGMSMRGKGKEFKGSPLNISVMEALKSKLSPGKQPAVAMEAILPSHYQSSEDSNQSVEDALSCRASRICNPPEISNSIDYHSPQPSPASEPVDVETSQTNLHTNTITSTIDTDFEGAAENTDNFIRTDNESKVDLHSDIEHPAKDIDNFVKSGNESKANINSDVKSDAKNIDDFVSTDNESKSDIVSNIEDPAKTTDNKSKEDLFGHLNINDFHACINKNTNPAIILLVKKVKENEKSNDILTLKSKSESHVKDYSSGMKGIRNGMKAKCPHGDTQDYLRYNDVRATGNDFVPRANIGKVKYKRSAVSRKIGQRKVHAKLKSCMKDDSQKVHFPQNNRLDLTSVHLNSKPKTISLESKIHFSRNNLRKSFRDSNVEAFSPFKLQQTAMKNSSNPMSGASSYNVASELMGEQFSRGSQTEKSGNSSLSSSEEVLHHKPVYSELQSASRCQAVVETSLGISESDHSSLSDLPTVSSSCRRPLLSSKSSPFLHSRYSVLDFQKITKTSNSKSLQPSNSKLLQPSKSRLLLPKSPTEQGRVIRRQIWHVKSPEEKLKRAYSFSPAEKVSQPTTEGNVLETRSKKNNSVHKKRRVDDDSYNPSSELSDIQQKFKKRVASGTMNSEPVYKLRGVRSDSSLGACSHSYLSCDSRTDIWQTGIVPFPNSKCHQLSAMYSDSALNYTNLECSVDMKNALPETNNVRESNDSLKSLKPIPYSQHLTERVKRDRKKKLQASSDSYQFKSQRKGFPEFINSETTRKLAHHSLLSNLHANSSSTPSPSSLSHFIGGGDFHDHFHNNSNLVNEDQFFSELPDFVEDPDLGNIENDILELQEQYLKPTDQLSPLPMFSTLATKLGGGQDHGHGSYVNRHEIVGAERTNMKQNQRVSITIAEDNNAGNWQRQNSQSHRNLPNKVVVESLPHVQTLLDRQNQFSAIMEPQITTDSSTAPVSQSNAAVNVATPQRTIENLFTGQDIDINTVNNLIATSLGYQNTSSLNTDNHTDIQASLVTQNRSNTAEYIGCINGPQILNTSQTYENPPMQQPHSDVAIPVSGEQIQTIEQMFTKGIATVPQTVITETSVGNQFTDTSVGNQLTDTSVGNQYSDISVKNQFIDTSVESQFTSLGNQFTDTSLGNQLSDTSVGNQLSFGNIPVGESKEDGDVTMTTDQEVPHMEQPSA